MSLFGSSPEEPAPIKVASKSRNTLFDDDDVSSTPVSKSSLFADDDAQGAWGLPTPKKSSREGLVKNLLDGADVPDSYVDTFDSLLKGDGTLNSGGMIGPAGVTGVLSAGKLNANAQSRIMTLVTPTGQLSNFSRNEFNVLLALIALAQENQEISLDSVDECRRARNLPVPKLSSLSITPTFLDASELAAKPPQRPVSPPAAAAAASPPLATQKPHTPRKPSIDLEADPWGSPALHKGHNHESASQRPNGVSSAISNGIHEPTRTTSNFTVTPRTSANGTSTQSADNTPDTPSVGGWGGYDVAGEAGAPFGNPSDSTVGGDGFGAPGEGDDPPIPNLPTRSFGGGRVSAGGVEENIIITLLPEKEGMFMFQHHNYQVSSPRRSSKVVRRYSDFVWLLDCLHKRYPFRQLPLLPPKRVGVNGNHLAADSTFIEKRRRGLGRFANALVRHPILSQEQLVIMFLTVPTELAVWRKQATISVQEEFAGKSLPPGLEDSLSPTLNDLFDTSRTGIRRSAEIYINLCNLVDRLSKRNEGLAADQFRLSTCLQSLTDVSQDTYVSDTNDVPLLNGGLDSMAKHLSNSQSLLEDEARAWDQGVLEDLKRQRDTLVSMRDIFDRRDRYDKDNIPYLERRIQTNENKLVAIRAKPNSLIKPGEIEKVTDAIIKDKQSIVSQHARGVFIKECIRDELLYFQSSQYHVSRLTQDWAQERVKYSELQADNWKQLQEEAEAMPLGE
ncbi:sorting nexin-like protein mvp1 [Amylocarpus encephaloides]|uniref:Sorting nexin MVP1 n=1 Tax=Amylocarpus encephaloides TaxID=45428 RepID=A0A9P7YRG0_9HELO|nr:sorting nexin-like protein mvp1 [Amylocarpus encephaloides]